MKDNLIMVLLIGNEVLPNAIPLKQISNIKTIEMIYTPLSETQAQNLESWMKIQGVKCHGKKVSNAEAFDVLFQIETVKEILKKHSDQSRILINVTGGTKPMALAASAVAASSKIKTIYVDTDNEKFWQVFPEASFKELKIKFDVKDILQLNGQQINFNHPTEAEQIAAQFLAENYEQLHTFRERLVKLKSDGKVVIKNDSTAQNFAQLCLDAGIFKIDSDGMFKLKNIGFFGQNGWLEFFVYKACREAGVDDVACQVQITGTKTDIDVMATCGAKVLAFSCKSGDFENKHLDEFNSVTKRIGGRLVKSSLIVTERPNFAKRNNPRSVEDSRRDLETRAKSYGMKVFYWTDYKNLAAEIKKLIQS